MYYRIKLYSIYRLKYKDYDSENGIVIQSEREMSLKELIQAFNIDEQDDTLLTVNGYIVNERNTFIPEGSTICIFPPLPNGG